MHDAENTKIEATSKLLTKANERLKKGIKNKDFTKIQLAQAQNLSKHQKMNSKQSI